MGRRDPLYNLLNVAIDIAGKRIAKEISKNNSEKYLPAVRELPNVKSETLIKDDIRNLIKVDRPQVYFDRDIGGLEEAKEELKKSVVYPIVGGNLYSLFEKPLSNVLMYGPPGCGKTLLAKAVATECRWPFIYPHSGDIFKRNIGDREKAVPYIFEFCRSLSENSILFLDELGQYMLRNGPPYTQRIKDEFEKEMDGIDTKKGRPVVIAASNRPWIIDPAMRRRGRFDQKIFIPPPNFYERKQIFRISMNRLLYKNLIEGDFETLVSYLSERTEGFSGADIVYLVHDAKDGPITEAMKGYGLRRLRKEDFDKVLNIKQPSIWPWFSEATRACKRYDEKEILEEIMKYSHVSN